MLLVTIRLDLSALGIDKEPPIAGRLPAALRLPKQLRGGLPQRFVGYYYQTLATPPLQWDGDFIVAPKVLVD